MVRRPAASWLVLVAAWAAACSSKSEVKHNGSASEGPAKAPPPATFTVFALAEVRGQVGPCGCTSDPLGDLSRTAKVIEEAKAKGPVIVVDAGSLLYSQNPVPPQLATQEELKANLLATVYRESLAAVAVGLGPADLAKGAQGVRFPRTEENVEDPAYPTTKAKLVPAGDAKVGVFGVIATGALPAVKTGDPVAAGKAAVASLRKQGAQIVIALVQASSKRDAVELARDIGGIDLAVAGLGAVAPEPERIEVEASKVGGGWLIVPANRGQIVSRVDVWVRGAGSPLADAIGRGTAAAKIARIDHEAALLDTELAKFAKDPAADPKFVANKKHEREQLVVEKKQLEAQPLVVPAQGSFFTLEQLRINKTLACDKPVQDLIRSYDQAAGEANVKAAAQKKVPAPAKGKASYVGSEACADCHQDQVDYWKKTVHAGAWKTLVDRGQQYDYSCIGCHVTGWEQPGGSNLAHNDKLRDVQCETCHGPGSIHVAKGGEEKPAALVRDPPHDLCATQCHTKEHSDTFEYTAYLRDIVGPGHGADRRKKLGDGPTGHELRSAALDKAGRALGAGCVK